MVSLYSSGTHECKSCLPNLILVRFLSNSRCYQMPWRDQIIWFLRILLKTSWKHNKIGLETMILTEYKLVSSYVFQLIAVLQEVSVHVYEKKGCDRVGRGRRREAIAELLKVNNLSLNRKNWKTFDWWSSGCAKLY